MRHIWKQVMAAFLVCVMAVTNIPVTAFAAENTALKAVTAEAVVKAIGNENISIETAHKIAQEIINGDYDYTNLDQGEKGLGTAVKTVLKFIKNNWSKVASILKKYGVILAEGKGVVEFIDQLLDGVIEVSDSIDAAIYAVVDFVAPDLDEDVKQVIANAIRLICPI